MWGYPIENDLLKQLSKHAKIAGAIMMLLGLAGIFFPQIMSVVVVVFVAWLMLLSGIVAGYFTWISDRGNWMGWLKSFILVLMGGVMLFYPFPGVAAMGLIFAVYFFMDSFSSFTLAMDMRPNKGWGWWLVNALLSLALGILFVMDWPFSSMWMVGLFVGISLFFDGITLFFMGRLFHKLDQDKFDGDQQ